MRQLKYLLPWECLIPQHVSQLIYLSTAVTSNNNTQQHHVYADLTFSDDACLSFVDSETMS
jgi:hypothetical protein